MSQRPLIDRAWRGITAFGRSWSGRSWGRFLRERRGATVMMYGLMLFPLIGFTGVAVDLARAYVARAQLQRALDAALLAAVHDVNRASLEADYSAHFTGTGTTTPTPSTDRDTTFNAYFRANFAAQNMMVERVDYTLTYDGTSNPPSLSATATAQMPTAFMRVFTTPLENFDTVNVATSGLVYAEVRGMEVVLVLDVTGSMATYTVSYPEGSGYVTISRLEAMKRAAHELTSILFGAQNSTDNLFIGLVPFATSVNINHPLLDDSNLDVYNANMGLVRPGRPTNATSGYDVANPRSSSSYRLYHASRTGWLTSTSASAITSQTYPYNEEEWAGCVMARWNNLRTSTTGYDTREDPPSSSNTSTQFTNYAWPRSSNFDYYSSNDRTRNNPYDHTVGSGYGSSTYRYRFPPGRSLWSSSGDQHWGPNRSCMENAIIPLIRERRIIDQAITNLRDIGNMGGTIGSLGLVWGWRVLSPSWHNQWYDGVGQPRWYDIAGNTVTAGTWSNEGVNYQLPLPYPGTTGAHPYMEKVVIFLTDGQNETVSNHYSAYGWVMNQSSSNGHPAVADINNREQAICNSMRSNGIIIYAIYLGSASHGDQALLENCVDETNNPNHFFLATDGDGLRQAFRTIGGQLNQIRLGR